MARRRTILFALLLAAALLPHPFDHVWRVPISHSQLLDASPLPIVGAHVGVMTIGEAWELHSSNSRFGGYSSMRLTGQRRFMLLSDNANIAHFTLGTDGIVQAARQWPLALFSRISRTKSGRDSESMTQDPATGQIWIGFEQYHRIMRFAPDLRWLEEEVAPPAMRHWNSNGGAEAMVRLHDGRFLVMAETSGGPGGGTDALVFPRDPTVAPAIPPMRFGYDSEGKGRVTDAVQLPDGRILLLHRRIDWLRGWVSIIAVADPADIGVGRFWHSRTLVTVQRPTISENFEGMAIEPAGDALHIWIVSDDNTAVWQRTLMLRLDWANWRQHQNGGSTRSPPEPTFRAS